MDRLKIKTDSRGVVRLSLTDTPRHNAFDQALVEAFSLQLEEISRSAKNRLLVLEATGPTFSAGAGLDWLNTLAKSDFSQNAAQGRGLYELFVKLGNLPLPVVCVVQGNVFGVAAGLVACADAVLCLNSVNFCFSEVRLGLVPAEAAPFVIQKIGPSQARRLFITGEVFPASHAREIGLVHWVLNDAQALQEQTGKVIQLCLKGGLEAQRLAKALVAELCPLPPESGDFATELAAHRRLSQEAQEGLRAFSERRAAAWVPGND